MLSAHGTGREGRVVAVVVVAASAGAETETGLDDDSGQLRR